MTENNGKKIAQGTAKEAAEETAKGHLPGQKSAASAAPKGSPVSEKSPAPKQESGAQVDVPEDVIGASQAWLVTSAVQAVLAVLSAIIYWLSPDALIASMGANSALEGIPADSRGVTVKAAIIVGMIFALIICGIFAALSKRILKGALGARLVLSIGTIFLVFQAISLFFATPAAPLAASPKALQFLSGAAQIISAVSAVAGLVLSSTKIATRFFEEKNPKIFNRDQ